MQRRSENQKEKERVRDRPALHDGIPWKEGPRQETVFHERKASQQASPLTKGRSPKKDACDYWHPPECVGCIKKGVANLESLRIQANRKGWRRTTEANEFCGGRPNIGSHPSRGGEHFAEVHSEGTLSARCVSDSGDISFTEHWELETKAVEVRMLCRTSNSEVAQILLKQAWNGR